ncbi:DegT/DnrJ/EryC1/StrS family aminotransferase [Nafulsella turpanensis]|uniref:DegT/DnrJ/EryC1/StrS family aminotransferase n=1 Tax=Nafulsella turpanensis TaxID=1265690 RepID=UPI0012695D58|nr:DegT/DnrJ/EryC1/StrS family aminotransferase [Nafulsella turpanensis]
MQQIEMVDLKGQYQHIKEEINAAIIAAVEEAAFINGPAVKAFAKELAEYNAVKHVIPCANGTDALQIAMMALGLQPGDEVIVPAFTYVATAEVIALLGLKPLFTEVDPATFNIDVKQLKEMLSPRTKAIVPVHLYGQCADMEPLLAFAKEHQLFIIEDTAQAIGAEYNFSNGKAQKAGTMGEIGATSFFPSKNLGCYGDGGALFTNDDAMAEKLQMIANHGQRVKYYHEVVGVNSRLDTIQAAVLRVKLRQLNSYINSRQKAAAYYDKALAAVEELELPFRSPSSSHVFHQYTLKIKNGKRDALKEYLAGKGIPSMVYYPVPLHLQQAYQSRDYGKGAFPVSEQLSQEVISLPMHTELTEEQLNYITTSVQSFFT